jgi:hypothetical protein
VRRAGQVISYSVSGKASEKTVKNPVFSYKSVEEEEKSRRTCGPPARTCSSIVLIRYKGSLPRPLGTVVDCTSSFFVREVRVGGQGLPDLVQGGTETPAKGVVCNLQIYRVLCDIFLEPF